MMGEDRAFASSWAGERSAAGRGAWLVAATLAALAGRADGDGPRPPAAGAPRGRW